MGRTIILFQLINLKFGIVVLEVEDIFDPGSPEGVNTLCVVAHHAEVMVQFSQLFHDQVLGEVGVLVLIHQNVPEKLLVFEQGIRKFFEKYIGHQE